MAYLLVEMRQSDAKQRAAGVDDVR